MPRTKPGKDYVGITTPFYCIDEEGKILFQKRSNKARDESGRWDPGSGELEKGLTLEENVRKEVKEEVGAEAQTIGRIPPHGIFREDEGEDTHWLAVSFFVKVNRDNVEINEPEKIDELEWAELGEFPQPLHKGFKQTFSEYREKFEDIIQEAKEA